MLKFATLTATFFGAAFGVGLFCSCSPSVNSPASSGSADEAASVGGDTTGSGGGSSSGSTTGSAPGPSQSWAPVAGTTGLGETSGTAIWAGTLAIFFGGDTCYWGCSTQAGSLFDTDSQAWTPLSSAGAPDPRLNHTAVWTGTQMIVWGGANTGGSAGTAMNTGGIYTLATDSWTPTSTTGAPSAREGQAAVWTGSEMIVWSGALGSDCGGGLYNDGARYNPTTDTWHSMSAINAPSPRQNVSAVWTGTTMIAWGGSSEGCGGSLDGDGAVYDPSTDTWQTMSAVNAPPPGTAPAFWTGSKYITWGTGFSQQGGIYDPGTDTWQPMSTVGAPQARLSFAAVFTGTKLIVWGGVASDWSTPLGDGGAYDIATDTWTTLPTVGELSARVQPKSLWDGSKMLIWGGSLGSTPLTDGAFYWQ